MAAVSDDVRLKAYYWCRDYLAGTWRQLKFSDFQIRDLRAGLSNSLYLCSLPSYCKCHGNEPREVLLRLYGKLLRETESPLLDAVVFCLLSERQRGPKLYGVFQEGRLEQYIPSRCLTTKELADPELSVEIAAKLAKFHQLNMPLCKVPRWLSEFLDKWTNMSLTVELDDPEQQLMLDVIRSHDIPKELEFVKKLIAKSKSPVVFCHNDSQEGNILLAQGSSEIKENSLMLIDIEFAGYNYRAADIANHFCQWTINLTKDSAPYFALNSEDYPTQEQQIRFIRAYLEQFGHRPGYNCDMLDMEEKEIVKEIKRFTPVIHFVWSSWSCVQATQSHGAAFDYMEYGLVRFNEYLRTKAALPSDLIRQLHET